MFYKAEFHIHLLTKV